MLLGEDFQGNKCANLQTAMRENYSGVPSEINEATCMIARKNAHLRYFGNVRAETPIACEKRFQEVSFANDPLRQRRHAAMIVEYFRMVGGLWRRCSAIIIRATVI